MLIAGHTASVAAADVTASVAAADVTASVAAADETDSVAAAELPQLCCCLSSQPWSQVMSGMEQIILDFMCSPLHLVPCCIGRIALLAYNSKV